MPVSIGSWQRLLTIGRKAASVLPAAVAAATIRSPERSRIGATDRSWISRSSCHSLRQTHRWTFGSSRSKAEGDSDLERGELIVSAGLRFVDLERLQVR